MGNEAPIAAGRRAVTALFADVAGSTRLGAELDPEDVVEVVGGAVRHFCEVVERYGGTVKDLAGDGILALFGAPSAHEDDPERAVLAGLEIQRVASHHARTIARSAGVDALGVRVGVETGIVVIAPVGGGSRLEMGATGDAVNIAARLQAAAEIGTVLVGPETRRQLGDSMLWGPTTGFELKGKRDVVEGTVALGSRERPVDLDVPLVGRGDEMVTLAGVIEDLRRGTGRTIIIVGEAGIGKSRLLAEARTRALDANVAWLDGRCRALEEGTPFAGLRDLLRSSPPGVAGEGEAGSIVRRLAEGEPAREEGRRSPEALRFDTLEAIATFASGVARRGPVILCFEDLHWSDPSTLDAVRRLRDVTRVDPVAVIATVRVVTEHASKALLTESEADPSTVVLTLGPLAQDEERHLLAELSGQTLPKGTEDSILSASDGVPLYLREFVRSLRGAEADRTVERGVPPTLDRLILARLDRLPAAARETLTALSVLGRDVDLAVARSSVLRDDPDASLLELVRQGLIDVEGTTCSFSHGLVQEVAYSTLLRDRRRELHRRAAETLETSSVEQQDATLAYHWEQAGEPAAAIAYHVAAADAAEAVSGLIEALGHVDAAVRLATESTSTPTSTSTFLSSSFAAPGSTITSATRPRRVRMPNGSSPRPASGATGASSCTPSRSSGPSLPAPSTTGRQPPCSMKRFISRRCRETAWSWCVVTRACRSPGRIACVSTGDSNMPSAPWRSLRTIDRQSSRRKRSMPSNRWSSRSETSLLPKVTPSPCSPSRNAEATSGLPSSALSSSG